MLDRVAAWPPNYVRRFAWRQQQLERMRSEPGLAHCAKAYYSTRPAEFIDHWCDTYDPRNAGTGVPHRLPLVLFRRQVEYVWFLDLLRLAQANGLVEKARDVGATFCSCGYSVWLWLFHPGSSVGWGSRKETLVDKLGDPDSIFEKMRIILDGLPPEFLPRGYDRSVHSTFMKIVNPENGATITGEAGDNIGRGGRKLMYFKDESAHYERPERIEAALDDNTRVQVDISSVHGLGNVFHRKREAGVDWEPGQEVVRGRTNVFVFDWRDHPAKTQEWYETRKRDASDKGLLANFYQEIDRNYASSVDGIIVQPEWFEASIGADEALGFADDGMHAAALDVADEGGDTNAFASRKGVVLKTLEEWGECDTGATARRAASLCGPLGLVDLQYDAVGVGAGVKAELNRLASDGLIPRGMKFTPWNAAAAALFPTQSVIPDDRESPKNADYFQNLKAQAWWQLARRFERTWRAKHQGVKYRPDELISVPRSLPVLRKLQKEISQATMEKSTKLKLVVNKTPNGTKSPNLADAVVMCYWPVVQIVRGQAAFGSYGL